MFDLNRLAAYSPWQEKPVSELAFTKQTTTKLKSLHIETIGELMVRSPRELRTRRTIGPKTIQEIVLRLAEHEIYLRESWRPKLDAIRYTYNLVASAPARVILPLRNADVWRAFERFSIKDYPQLTKLGDFHDFSLELFDRFIHDNIGRGPLLLADEREDMINVLTELKYIKGYDIFLQTRENSASLAFLPE